jgi:hypothetical protein
MGAFVFDPLAQALTRYQNLVAAENAILNGQQAYSVGGRSATRARLQEIQIEIARLEKRIPQLQARQARGGIRIRGAVPL